MPMPFVYSNISNWPKTSRSTTTLRISPRRISRACEKLDRSKIVSTTHAAYNVHFRFRVRRVDAERLRRRRSDKSPLGTDLAISMVMHARGARWFVGGRKARARARARVFRAYRMRNTVQHPPTHVDRHGVRAYGRYRDREREMSGARTAAVAFRNHLN